MTTLNYLAYGSNLYTPRLTARIGICAVLGTIALAGYQLQFNKRGADGSGKCNLQVRHGAWAYGVVYRINSIDKPTLDHIEGVGHGYYVASWRDAGYGECFFYAAQTAALDDTLLPFDWYQAYVVAGARQHRLPVDYIAAIANVPSRIDVNAQRRAENLARLT